MNRERRPQGDLSPIRPKTWAGRSVEERALAIEAACRAAMQLIADQPDRQTRLRRVDPVPESTRAHLRRLASAR